MRKITSWAILLAFLVSCIMPPNGFAQMIEGVGLMPEPGAIVHTSPAFVPAHLMGVMINARDPLKFDFLIRKGEGAVTADEKNVEYRKLIKYFLAAMTIPDSDQWVNLSPYENDRIIQENFGMTEMGRDLLAQDYLLKQLTASLIHPDTDLGKTFWERVYKRAQTEFGTTDIPLNAFNKVWITPDKATVWEKGNTAYVIESHLKVLTEQDYVSLQKNSNSSVFGTDQASSQEVNEVARLSGDIVRDVLIPEIEKEVNEGKNFAPLRQIFASMILATWYKKALKESLLGEVYADRAKVKGVDQDPRNNTMIYDQYLAAFKKGVVNLIKEDIDEYSQEIIPRKYFSGGYDPEGMKRAFKRDSSQVPPPAARRLLDDAQGSNVDLAQVALNAAPSGTAAQKAPAQLSLPVQKTFTAIRNQDKQLWNTGVKRLSEIVVQAQANPEELAALVREGDAVARNPNNNDTKIHAYPLGIRYEWSTRDLYYQFTGFVDGIVAGRISLEAVNAYAASISADAAQTAAVPALSVPVQKTFTAIRNQDKQLWNTGVKRLSEIIVQAQANPEELAALVREGDAIARNPNNNDTKIHAYPLGIRYEWSTRDLYYQFTGFVDGIVAGRISLDAVNAYVQTQDSAQSLVESLMIQGGRMLANLKAKGGEKYTNPALPYDDRTAYELLSLTFEHMVNMVRVSDGVIKDQQRQMAQATYGLYSQIAPLIPNYVPVKFSDISDFAQSTPERTAVRNAAMDPQEVLRQVLDAGPNRWISVAEPASGEVVIQRGLSGAAEMDSYQGDGVQEALRILRGEESTNKRSFSVASSKASLDQLTYEVTDQYTGPLAMRFAVQENMLDRNGLSDEHVFATGVGRENIVQVGLFGNRTDPLGWARAYLQMVKQTGAAFTAGSVGEKFYKEVLNIEAKKVLEDTEFGKRIVNADEIGRMYRDLFEDSRFREAQQPVVPLQEPAVQSDKAMKGGIDLNAANLNMQIKRDGNGVMLPMSQQNLENIRIDGLIPEILSIVPATTLPMLSEAAGSSGSSV